MDKNLACHKCVSVSDSIVTGLSMQYTDKENATYVVGFAKAVRMHNFAALILVINYIFFCLRKFSHKKRKLLQNQQEKFHARSDKTVQILLKRNV